MSTPTPPPYQGGPTQGPGYGAMPPAPPGQPGQPAPPGQPGWTPPGGPRPSKQGSSAGLVIGLGALVLVLLIGAIVAAGILIARGDDTGTTATSPAPTATAPTPTATTQAATPTEPATTAAGGDASEDGRITTADFPGDWNFKFDNVKLDATRLASHDYPSCGPVASTTIVHLGCRYAAMWVYQTDGGKLRMAQMAYVYDTETHAKQAADQGKESDYKLPAVAEIKHFSDGKWEHRSSGKVEIVTLVTVAKGVPDKDLISYLNYGETDLLSAIGFMDIS